MEQIEKRAGKRFLFSKAALKQLVRIIKRGLDHSGPLTNSVLNLKLAISLDGVFESRESK
jgi:hypothetical protein